MTDGSHYSPKSVDKGFYMVSVKDFAPYGFDFSSCRLISETDYNILKKNGCIPKFNDILVGKDGARFFEDVIIYRQSEQPALLSSIAILRCHTEYIVPEFLYYTFKTPAVKKDVRENYGSGSAIPRVVLKDFKRMPIQYPDICTQRAIATTLSSLDDKIELNNKISQNLEAQAQALFKSWFVDFEPFQNGEFVDSEMGRIPKGWKVHELGNLFSFVKGKKPQLTYLQQCTCYESYLTIEVLNGSAISYASSEKMVTADELDTLMVMDGASSGTCYFGKSGIVGSTLSKVSVIDRMNTEVIHQTLKYYEPFIKERTTGSAIPHTDKNLVLQLKIALPNNILSISKLFENYRQKIIILKKQSQTLATLRDTLLPKLMSGEIEVPV